MRKTTLYLPDELKERIARAAAAAGLSEAEFMRRGLDAAAGGQRPAPRAGIIDGDEDLSERVEELLADFGT